MRKDEIYDEQLQLLYQQQTEEQYKEEIFQEQLKQEYLQQKEDQQIYEEYLLLEYQKCYEYSFKSFLEYKKEQSEKKTFSNVYLKYTDQINEIEQQILMQKQYLNIISIQYLIIDDYQTWYNGFQLLQTVSSINELGIKVFDTKLLKHKFLKIESLLYNNINFDQYQDFIDKYKYFDIQKRPELEKIRKIENECNIQLDDIYLIKLSDKQNYIIYEIEQIDLPYEIYLRNTNKENKDILTNFISNLSKRYKQQQNQYQKFFYVKINEDNKICIKSFFNVMSCMEIKYYGKYGFQEKFNLSSQFSTYLSEELTERVIMSQKHLKNSLRKQLKLIQKNVKIQKQNMVVALDLLAPSLMEFHPKEIFEIISQHPKYHFFSLKDFNQDYIIFKAYNTNQKYFLKLLKFTSYQEAYTKKLQYEQLKQFQQENQGIFFDIEDCEVICSEKLWYVLLEENLTFTLKQNNQKLIAFKKIEKIQKYFKLNCSQEYISKYLITKSLNHYEKMYSSGFQCINKFECQPYLFISDENKISLNQVIFSNPFIDQNYRYQLSKYLDLFDSFYNDISSDNLEWNFIYELGNYIIFQQKNNFMNTLDELSFQFPQFYFIVKQIEQYILFYEQYPNLPTDSLLFNKNFKIIQNVKLHDLIEENQTDNQFVQFESQSFACSFEQIQIYQKYLPKNNNIQYLAFENSSNKEEKEFNLNKKVNDELLEKEQLLNEKSFFQKVKKLSVYQIPNVFMGMQINQQLFPSVEKIEINIKEYEEDKFERFQQFVNILTIFQNIKTFKKIKIDMNIFSFSNRNNLKQIEALHIYTRQKNKQVNNDYSENSVKFQQIKHFLCLNDVKNQTFVEIKKYNNIAQNIKQQLIQIQSIFKSVDCDPNITAFNDGDTTSDYLLLTFKDNSDFNFGEIKITLKLKYQQGGISESDPLQIVSYSCQNQKKKYQVNNIYDIIYYWISDQIEQYIQDNIPENLHKCNCNQFYYIALKIYKGQQFIKSMTLDIQDLRCQSFCTDIFLMEIGLSEGNQFKYLQELCLKFTSNKFNDKSQKDLVKIINKNKRINTIKYYGIKFPKYMLKLIRVVKIEVLYK